MVTSCVPKNIIILNTAHVVTADYMDLSAREAIPIVFPSDCNQHTLRQVCISNWFEYELL